MSIIITITIVLNICQGHFRPMAAGWWSALFSVPRDTPVISCAAMRDWSLCIRCLRLCVRVCLSECVCVFVWGRWMSEVSQDCSSTVAFCWFVLRGGSAPRGRRFRCCRRFPWPSSAVLRRHVSPPSAASWLPAAACPRPSPRSCPSLPTVWASTASLAQMMEAACCRPAEMRPKRTENKMRLAVAPAGDGASRCDEFLNLTHLWHIKHLIVEVQAPTALDQEQVNIVHRLSFWFLSI